MEMSSMLLPVGSGSPGILLRCMLAFEVDLTYRPFVMFLGISISYVKRNDLKRASVNMSVCIAMSLFHRFYMAERLGDYRHVYVALDADF